MNEPTDKDRLAAEALYFALEELRHNSYADPIGLIAQTFADRRAVDREEQRP